MDNNLESNAEFMDRRDQLMKAGICIGNIQQMFGSPRRDISDIIELPTFFGRKRYHGMASVLAKRLEDFGHYWLELDTIKLDNNVADILVDLSIKTTHPDAAYESYRNTFKQAYTSSERFRDNFDKLRKIESILDRYIIDG